MCNECIAIPSSCNMANASEVKFEYDDVAVHLYWPWCCGRTELIVRDLSLAWTKFDDYHLYEKSPIPKAEHKNVALPYTLAMKLLGLIVTFGGDTIKY